MTHSRSSSEVETTSLRDVLPKLIKDFNADFDFYDVKDLVKNLFSEEELQLILSEVDVKKQINQLFWILYDFDEYKIEQFLASIKLWYPWLSQSVFRERDKPSKATEIYINAVRALRSDFQKHLDHNVHRMEYYWPVRTALKKLKPFNYLVVSGDLGCGKKWLVVDVCSEYGVMEAMGFNIFRLNVRNCHSKEDDFRALQQFRLLIGEGDSTTTWRQSSEFDGVDNKILHLQQYIRCRLQCEEFKDCLLILFDVPNSKAWKAFNLGCKILIVTRNRKIASSLSKSTTTHIIIEHGLTLPEYFRLFEKVLRRRRRTFPKEATDMYLHSGGQPYLLSIIANNLKFNKKPNWSEWIRNLQNLQINDNKFMMIVKMSLEVLRPNERNLYKALAIFPHSIQIPLKLIAALWDKTERETGNILETFDKYSIIHRSNFIDESIACVLPYVYSSYLKTEQNIDRIGLHQKVVDYYRITDALENRVEIDLFSNRCDYYFYHCIGYHLRESGYLDLFPKLFLDFGFLGEKLRADGFANTIGDLKHFRTAITNGDHYKTNLLNELLEFLPSIEEMLFRSKDTCLLQYALMADGIVNEEAIKQASSFPDKIWFKEKGHFHQRRQMVSLPNKPKLIKLPEPDTCIIALDNNDILLADLSLDYNNGPVYLTDNKYSISKIKLILQDNYIIALDVEGNLKVWSITDDRRRSASRKRNSRTKVNPLNLTQTPDMFKRKCKQVIQKNVRGSIQTFHIESTGYTTDLHLAFANGDICIYSWSAQREQFELKSVPILPTKVEHIIYLSKILDKYYMTLSRSGKIYFYNLRDSSRTATSFEWAEPIDLVHIAEYKKGFETHVIFVYREQVIRLSFSQQKFEFLNGQLETIYNINENDFGNVFTCAQLSRDGLYLVLGTKHGLIIFNTEQKVEVLRGNVSQCIECVDIYPLDDNVYKYIIVCGSKHSNVLNLFALRQMTTNVITWSHRLISTLDIQSVNDTNIAQLEPDVWLQGKKLFDLNYSDSVLLVAVDSKNRIHQLCTTDTKTWSISLPPESSRQITAITSFNQTSFCGYDNGEIFNISKEVFEEKFTEDSITFLQMINENTLVASANQAKQSIVRHIGDGSSGVEIKFDIDVFRCYTLFDSFLVLLEPQGGFIIADLRNKFKQLHTISHIPKFWPSCTLGGYDLQNNFLFLSTASFKIYIYSFHMKGNELVIKMHKSYANSENFEESDEVTCLAASSDASLLAVGLRSGTIEIYQMEPDSFKFIYRLLSHTSQIYDLKFSPNTELLVSCSEQLCFWHVSYILNNPFDSGTKQKRRSSRFTSSRSPVEEVTDGVSLLSHSENGDTYELQNPWSNKRGPMEKPELLSCIKFVGNKAEKFYANDDFTQFNTIDNEGVYYHLCVHDISRRVTTNGTNGSIDDDIEDEVIT